MSVATLLAGSRSSHLLAKVAQSKGQPAADHWQAALEMRLQADEADPEHADPAWLEDALHPKMPGEPVRRYHRIPGKTPAQVARDKDRELVAFFRSRLESAPPAEPVTLTAEELAARIVVPQHWRQLVAPNPELPPCKPHLWDAVTGVRTCTACGAQEELVDKLALEDTAAFQQLVKECGPA